MAPAGQWRLQPPGDRVPHCYPRGAPTAASDGMVRSRCWPAVPGVPPGRQPTPAATQNSGRGASRLVADALKTAKACGAGGPEGKGPLVLRADSAFYTHDVIAAARRAKVRFSITARMNPAVRKAITEIVDDSWTPITYPNAVWDEDEQRLVSDAQVAENEFTAFTSPRKSATSYPSGFAIRVHERRREFNPTAGGLAHVHDEVADLSLVQDRRSQLAAAPL